MTNVFSVLLGYRSRGYRNHGNRGYNILTGIEPFDLSPYFLIIWTQKWTQNQRALSKSSVKKSDHIFSGID